MGACMRKPEKNTKNIQTDGSINQDSSKKKLENSPKHVKKTEPISNSKSGQNISKKKSHPKKKKNPVIGGPPLHEEVEKDIATVQQIILQKKEIIKKKNLQLEDIKANKKLFLKDLPSHNHSKSNSLLNSAEILDRRIQTIVEKNKEVTKDLDHFNQELVDYSVGLRKGSVTSEEIRDSVRKALSKFAHFDIEIQKIQNSGGSVNNNVSLSPLKVPTTMSKILKTSDLQNYSESPLIMLRKILEEKNNEMDNRNNIIEMVKNGEEENEETKKYKEKIQKKMRLMQLTDLDKLDHLPSEVVLEFDDKQ